MGFVKKATEEAEIVKRPVEDIRDCFRNSIEKRLKILNEKKFILYFKQIFIDSWLLISLDFWETFKSIDEILKAKLPLEVAIHILNQKNSIEDVMLSNESMQFLKNKIIEKHRNWYKERNKDSIVNTFILLTEDAYKELEYKWICYKPYENSEYYLIDYSEFEIFNRNLDRIQGEFAIKPRGYMAFNIKIESGDTLLHGDFTTCGGPRNSILARIYDKENYDNWINGHFNNGPLFDSGLVTTRYIEFKLAVGEYYFLFSNRYEDIDDDSQYDKIVSAKIKIIPLPRCTFSLT